MNLVLLALLAAMPGLAQEPPPGGARVADAPTQDAAAPRMVRVPSGTRIPLQLINRVTTRNARPGDQVYLQTAFPITVENRVVIPPGSYVRGTITQVKRPGRVKGRGELYLRFDAITLPNGVTRNFLGRVGAVEGSGSESMDQKEGKIQSDSSKGHDAGTIGTTAAAGTSVGAIAGSAAGRPGLGTAVGAAGGAAAGLAQVLLTRGPDVVLERGSTVDMVLDRELVFREDEVQFSGGLPRVNIVPAPGNQPSSQQRSRLPFPLSRWPWFL